ncbi:MAG: DUF4388 domain-containing protein [Myxococcota bacterium]|nr:DUF4388 domain-containing protein [Myxococcota bacterium]
MSLVGSLEDLGLGEIMQIVSLSGKSGILWIRSRHGEGHVLFRRGLIRGAFVKDGPRDLRDLVASAGILPAAQVEALDDAAREEGVPLEALLCARTSLDAGCLDELRGRHVEATVLRMFAWPSGEFSFEIRDEPGGGDIAEDLLLRTGLNAQFLALEGTRMRDEGAHESPEIGGRSSAIASDDETSFAGVDVEDSEPVAEMADADVIAMPVDAVVADDAEAIAMIETAAFAEPAESAADEIEEPQALAVSVLELVDDEVDGNELPVLLSAPEADGEALADGVDEETTLSAMTRSSAAACGRDGGPGPAAAGRTEGRRRPAAGHRRRSRASCARVGEASARPGPGARPYLPALGAGDRAHSPVSRAGRTPAGPAEHRDAAGSDLPCQRLVGDRGPLARPGRPVPVGPAGGARDHRVAGQ